jgi:hypothetical protein
MQKNLENKGVAMKPWNRTSKSGCVRLRQNAFGAQNSIFCLSSYFAFTRTQTLSQFLIIELLKITKSEIMFLLRIQFFVHFER